MSDQSKLSPCPFCGGEASIARRGTARVSNQVACADCGTMRESGDVFDPTAAWNYRPIESALRAEVGKLAEELDTTAQAAADALWDLAELRRECERVRTLIADLEAEAWDDAGLGDNPPQGTKELT